jgi:hypothetical protein
VSIRSLLFLGILIVTGCSNHRGGFELINNSGQAIAKAEITVCKQKIEFRGVPMGQRTQGHYQIRGDSHYDLKITFESGRKMEGNLGYVTSGVDVFDEFIVTDLEIQFARRKAGRNIF